jgi:trans-aconitate 2-methyltransferase
MPRDWDASTYERLAAPLTAMGHDVLDRLVLRGDETVLDAGCGTGGVTRALYERLPHGRVIAVDAAPSMVEQARALLPPAVDVRRADLLELDVGEPVDAVLSTATFHWIPDHERLFARLHAALAPGGRLVAQCGGDGNVAAVKQAGIDAATDPRFAPYLGGWTGDWHFATAADTERRLRAAGFSDVWCWLSASTSIPATRPATSARSASARSSRDCRRTCTTTSSRPRSSGCRSRWSFTTRG